MAWALAFNIAFYHQSVLSTWVLQCLSQLLLTLTNPPQNPFYQLQFCTDSGHGIEINACQLYWPN